MQQYAYYCEAVGFNRADYKPPEIHYTFVAYKEGKVFPAATRVEALKISKNVEMIADLVSKAAHEKYLKTRRELEGNAFGMWYADLQSDYISTRFTEEMFNKVYSLAYDDGHASGHDEVVTYFDKYYDLVTACLDLKKG